ncbi:hypothetical protein AAHH78_36650, partial [Burkholderia pseudomallei]
FVVLWLFVVGCVGLFFVLVCFFVAQLLGVVVRVGLWVFVVVGVVLVVVCVCAVVLFLLWWVYVFLFWAGGWVVAFGFFGMMD